MTPSGGDGHDVPAVVAGETETLLAFLGYLRGGALRKLDGVTEEDARRRLVPSRTTLLGIVKHLTFVEAYWGTRRLTGADITEVYDGFDLEDADDVASICARYAAAAARTDENVMACTGPDHVLARGRRGLTVRWMLVHMIEETARHAGHADILRELIDGTTQS
jgi:hypothetical protein